jgi:hypothetical protein
VILQVLTHFGHVANNVDSEVGKVFSGADAGAL